MHVPTLLEPPAPLTGHERMLELVKARPPEPTWAYYLLAAGTSIGGLILGGVYLIKDGAANKRFGLLALLLGFALPLAVLAIVLLIRAGQVSTTTPANAPGVLLP